MVSAAYYALFHLLISETTRNWKRPQERYMLARMFEHDRMKKAYGARRDVLIQLLKKAPSKAQPLTVEKHLTVVAETFVRMQEHRHTAEYDGSIKWTRTDTLIKIDSVTTAFKSWKSIRKDSTAQNFLVTLLLRDR